MGAEEGAVPNDTIKAMQVDGVGDDSGRPRPRLIHGATAGVVLAGIVITVVLSLGASVLHDSNENRLLAQRGREAATSFNTTLATIQTPLTSASDLAEATDGDSEALQAQLNVLVTAGQRFVSASVWRLDGSSTDPVVVVGTRPLLASMPADEIRAVLARAAASPRLAVFDLMGRENPGVGYSVVSSNPDPRFVTYVERVLPANRTRYVRDSDAFSGLDNALYLGKEEDPAKLLTASRPDLPFEGRRRVEVIPWGDSSLTLVVSPKGDLGGGVAARLWWLLLIAGAVVTAGMGYLFERLLRQREQAQALAGENRRLYAEQRSVAQTLQHSLLPRISPTIGGLAFASMYEPASAEGVDIGGDWYDAISVDPNRIVFVVGDVSGRGLGAATVMASMRYSIRAYASHGLDPAVILGELNHVLDVDRDGHFATVVCAVVDVDRREVTFASAGHPPLLLVEPEEATFARVAVGPPVGVAHDHVYESATVPFGSDLTIVAFTDGLFERRGETIDDGLERLRTAGSGSHHPNEPAEVLQLIRERLGPEGADDDTAMLGVAWSA